MGKLHLKFGSAAPATMRFDPDARRSDAMASRFIEGLRTIDAPSRRKVFQALAGSFCTACGSNDPACRCQEIRS